MIDDTEDDETCGDTSSCACCGLVRAENPSVPFEVVRDEEMLFGECVDRDACEARMTPGGWHS